MSIYSTNSNDRARELYDTLSNSKHSKHDETAQVATYVAATFK